MSRLAQRVTTLDRRALLVAALVAQLVLLVWVSAPLLSPRLFGDEYRVAVHALDPVDPFRGRYVELAYADPPTSLGSGRVWLALRKQGGLWQPAGILRDRPSGQPALRCQARNDTLHCGIESFFASEDQARRLDQALRVRGAIARVRIDGAGRAAIIGLDPR